MNVLELIVMTFAVARATRFVLFDAGPMAFMDRVRWIAGTNRNFKRGSLAHWFNCPWCVSMWLGVAAAVFYFVHPEYAIAVAAPLAISFVAAWLITKTHEV